MEQTEQEVHSSIQPTEHEQIQKAVLSPDVAAYATNIEQQLKGLCTTHGIPDMASFGAYARTHPIPDTDLRTFATLLDELNHIKNTGEIPNEAYVQRMKQHIAAQWESVHIDQYIGALDERDFNNVLDTLSQNIEIPPSALFQSDTHLLEKILTAIHTIPFPSTVLPGMSDHIKSAINGLAGAIGTRILNNSLRDLSKPEREHVLQVISHDAGGVGYDLQGGNLKIEDTSLPMNLDDRFQGLGRYMRSGTITSEILPPLSGDSMRGGIIHAKHATDFIGHEMIGGEIHIAENANYNLGYGMEGGRIICHSAGTGMGSYMKDGAITVEDALDDVGLEMKGGLIEIRGNCTDNVGNLMQGGEIRIAGDAGNQIGFYMGGGEIHIEGHAGDQVGYFMEGGLITVHSCGDYVAEEMKGGKIIIQEQMGYLSPSIQPGAIVEYKGQIIRS